MKDFLFIYRTDLNKLAQRTEEEMQATMKQWMDWLGSIAAQNKLVSNGNRLGNTGKVVKSANVVTNGPYSDIKEAIGGYSIVKTDSYDDAVELAKGCPVLAYGGNVEVREVLAM